MKIAEFDRKAEPAEEGRTMEWGVKQATKTGIPDVIYDRGAVGKEAMIRVFANNPREMVRLVEKIARNCSSV